MRHLKVFLQLYQKQIQKTVLGALTLIILLPLVLLVNRPDGKLQLYFFDVGQGDSIFIKTPQNYQILIDGGPSEKVVWELSKAMPFYDRSLDLVISTHPHADHIDGLIEILKRYRVQKLLINEISYESPDYQEFLSLIERQKIPQEQFLADAVINLQDGVLMESFWPKAQTDIFEILDVNRASMVFRLSYGNFSTLFTSDAELGEENPKLASFGWQKVSILKIPHQGSKSGLTQEVLEKLQPDLAIITVGPNRFGHPSLEILSLLQENKIKTLRTDENGTIEIVADTKGWFVK